MCVLGKSWCVIGCDVVVVVVVIGVWLSRLWSNIGFLITLVLAAIVVVLLLLLLLL